MRDGCVTGEYSAIFPVMKFVRRSRFPALVLQMALGFALFLPELGHDAAHERSGRHAEAQHSHDHGHDHVSATDLGHSHPRVTSGEAADAHPHSVLQLSRPIKPPTAFVVVTLAAIELIPVVTEPSLHPPAAYDPLPLAGRSHAPPPPSRAPPIL